MTSAAGQVESRETCFVRRRSQRRDGAERSTGDACVAAPPRKRPRPRSRRASAKSCSAAASSRCAVEIVAASGMLGCLSSGSSSACRRLRWYAPSAAAALRLPVLLVDVHDSADRQREHARERDSGDDAENILTPARCAACVCRVWRRKRPCTAQQSAFARALLHAEPPCDFPYSPFLEALDKTSHRRMDGFRRSMPFDIDSMYIIWRDPRHPPMRASS